MSTEFLNARHGTLPQPAKLHPAIGEAGYVAMLYEDGRILLTTETVHSGAPAAYMEPQAYQPWASWGHVAPRLLGPGLYCFFNEEADRVNIEMVETPWSPSPFP